jgi:AcrR family transcriptional regulator
VLFLIVTAVFVTPLVACIALWAVRRWVPYAVRKESNEVGGIVYGAMSMFYALVLAFVIVAAWESESSARQNVGAEAAELRTIYLLADHLPAASRQETHRLALAYAETVVDTEWPAMDHHHGSPQAQDLADELNVAIANFSPQTNQDQEIYGQLLDRFHDFYAARLARLAEAADTIPVAMWIGLIAGGVVTVGFTLMFGMRRALPQQLMTVLLTATMAYLIYLVYDMTNCFDGAIKINPDALRESIALFKQWGT